MSCCILLVTMVFPPPTHLALSFHVSSDAYGGKITKSGFLLVQFLGVSVQGRAQLLGDSGVLEPGE